MATTMGRPAETEYHPYYRGYVSLVTEDDVIDALEQQTGELRKIAAAASPEKETFRYAPEKWSIRQLFGHLIDAEKVFGYRAHCISRGEQAALPGFDEQSYVAKSSYAEVPLSDLVEELALLRRTNVILLRRVDDEPGGWGRTGNANGANISMRGLAHVVLGHVRHHMGVLRDRYGVTA